MTCLSRCLLGDENHDPPFRVQALADGAAAVEDVLTGVVIENLRCHEAVDTRFGGGGHVVAVAFPQVRRLVFQAHDAFAEVRDFRVERHHPGCFFQRLAAAVYLGPVEGVIEGEHLQPWWQLEPPGTWGGCPRRGDSGGTLYRTHGGRRGTRHWSELDSGRP